MEKQDDEFIPQSLFNRQRYDRSIFPRDGKSFMIDRGVVGTEYPINLPQASADPHSTEPVEDISTVGDLEDQSQRHVSHPRRSSNELADHSFFHITSASYGIEDQARIISAGSAAITDPPSLLQDLNVVLEHESDTLPTSVDLEDSRDLDDVCQAELPSLARYSVSTESQPDECVEEAKNITALPPFIERLREDDFYTNQKDSVFADLDDSENTIRVVIDNGSIDVAEDDADSVQTVIRHPPGPWLNETEESNVAAISAPISRFDTWQKLISYYHKHFPRHASSESKVRRPIIHRPPHATEKQKERGWRKYLHPRQKKVGPQPWDGTHTSVGGLNAGYLPTHVHNHRHHHVYQRLYYPRRSTSHET